VDWNIKQIRRSAEFAKNRADIHARDNELGVMKGSFWQSLVAVLAGNAIYLLVEPFLPPRAQHKPYQIDWGLAVDFWICLVCYGFVKMIRRRPPPA